MVIFLLELRRKVLETESTQQTPFACRYGVGADLGRHPGKTLTRNYPLASSLDLVFRQSHVFFGHVDGKKDLTERATTIGLNRVDQQQVHPARTDNWFTNLAHRQ